MHAHDLLAPLQLRSHWWPRLLAFAAGAAVLWLLARMLLLLIGGPLLPQPQLPADAATMAPTAVDSDVRLSQWHLFGDAGTAPDLARLVQQAPETALQLFLRGTLNVDSSDGGIAIIADAQGQEQAYRVGDTLPGDARLTAIYAGRVLLSRGGVDEGLSLLPNSRGTGVARPASAAPGAAATSAPGLPGSVPAPTPFVAPQMNFGAPSMESFRAAVGTDIAELAKQVSVQPVMENGRFAGVRLTVGRDSDVLARTGLRSTDIITAVNGIPLDGPQRQAELLTALQGARQISLTVRRDGQTQTLTVGL